MTIIQPFSGGVTGYLVDAANWFLNISFTCPQCKGCTHRHGKFLRTVYDQETCSIIPIFRRRCPNCKLSFSFIPSFIKPYARFLNSYRYDLFENHVLKEISIKQTPFVLNSSQEITVSVTTFRRWLKRLKEIAPEANKQLAQRLLELKPALSLPKELSEIKFLLTVGTALHIIIKSILLEESSVPSAVFDVLNLILPQSLLL